VTLGILYHRSLWKLDMRDAFEFNLTEESLVVLSALSNGSQQKLGIVEDVPDLTDLLQALNSVSSRSKHLCFVTLTSP
jgi:hypothetical protein